MPKARKTTGKEIKRRIFLKKTAGMLLGGAGIMAIGKGPSPEHKATKKNRAMLESAGIQNAGWWAAHYPGLGSKDMQLVNAAEKVGLHPQEVMAVLEEVNNIGDLLKDRQLAERMKKDKAFSWTVKRWHILKPVRKSIAALKKKTKTGH